MSHPIIGLTSVLVAGSKPRLLAPPSAEGLVYSVVQRIGERIKKEPGTK